MIVNPFRLFDSFPEVQVAFFAKTPALLGTNDEIDAQAAEALGISHSVSAAQVHGNKTAITHEDDSEFPDADALVTAEHDLCLVTRWADCQNFVVFAPKQKVIGVIHAGWRGLVKGVIPEHFKALETEWGIEPSDVFVGAGPSLCQKCAEFTDPAQELTGIDSRFFDGRNVDLRGIAEEQFNLVGVTNDHFERIVDCTQCQSNQYWSYRANPSEVKNGGKNLTTIVRSL